MAEVKILIEGYARKTETSWYASSTTVLIKDSGKNIIVDPGANEKMLLEALEREGLKPENIDIVFLTHYHLDHLLNIALFPGKDIYDGDSINSSDSKIVIYEGNIPDTNVQIIPTPGHAHEHVSLLVETEKGKIVIAGDLFWWRDNQEPKLDKKTLLEHKDPYTKDENALLESRKKILGIADYIIPGHGKMFKVI